MSRSLDFRWEAAGLSDPGKVRRVNEDGLLVKTDAKLWLVADGMGGHSAGDVASRMITQAFDGLGLPDSLSGLADAAERYLLDINRRLRTMSQERPDQAIIGSTVAALLAHERYALVIWVGDSRIYRLRRGTLQQLTQDHSQVEEMIMQGFLLREGAENHPAANVVTRAVGAADDVYVDMDYCDLQPGDRFLICSDGLTKEVRDEEISEALAREGTSEEICRNLIELSLNRGARDNVTVVIAKVLE